MKRTLLISLAVLAVMGGIIVSIFMMSKENTKAQKNITENLEIADKITDECTDEYDAIKTELTEEANSNETEKTSPNTIITFEKFYKGCEHIVSRYQQIDSSLVNATKEDIQAKYDKWQLKEFSKDKIVLYQEVDGSCGEHYMLRDVNGRINIYKLDENGNETLLEETDIATRYLTETDMIDMENGLIVYGKESLNKLLEDFE